MICDDMIVGAARMAHSAVEGSQATSLIVRPGGWKKGGLSFFYTIYYTNFFTIFFSAGDNTQQGGLSQDVQ